MHAKKQTGLSKGHFCWLLETPMAPPSPTTSQSRVPDVTRTSCLTRPTEKTAGPELPRRESHSIATTHRQRRLPNTRRGARWRDSQAVRSAREALRCRFAPAPDPPESGEAPAQHGTRPRKKQSRSRPRLWRWGCSASFRVGITSNIVVASAARAVTQSANVDWAQALISSMSSDSGALYISNALGRTEA